MVLYAKMELEPFELYPDFYEDEDQPDNMDGLTIYRCRMLGDCLPEDREPDPDMDLMDYITVHGENDGPTSQIRG